MVHQTQIKTLNPTLMQTEKEQLEHLKKLLNTFFEMQKVAPSKKGNWQFMVKKKEVETEIKELIKPPPPPSQAMLEFFREVKFFK